MKPDVARRMWVVELGGDIGGETTIEAPNVKAAVEAATDWAAARLGALDDETHITIRVRALSGNERQYLKVSVAFLRGRALTSGTTRDSVRALLTEWRRAQAEYHEQTARNGPLEQACVRKVFETAQRKHRGKQKLTSAQAHDLLIASGAIQALYIAREKVLYDAIKTAAEAFRAAAVGLPGPVLGKNPVAVLIYSNAYTSAGERYNRGRAELYVAELAAVSIPAKVSDTAEGGYWKVLVSVEDPELDAELVKFASPPMRETVRLAWKLGLNPRVYFPFLPHGFEEANGLDYFGGETKPHDLKAEGQG